MINSVGDGGLVLFGVYYWGRLESCAVVFEVDEMIVRFFFYFVIIYLQFKINNILF